VNTRRPRQSLFWCLDCETQYNADWNSAINIGSVFFAARLSRKAIEGLAHAGDELAYKPASPEARSEALTQARQQL
jgi:transposase